MKSSLALLAIFILAGVFYMHCNTKPKAESFNQEFDNYLEQTSGFEFRTQDSCRIGSSYIFGDGCTDPIFTNSLISED